MSIADYINPLFAVDQIARVWAKATYNTPIQSIPVIGIKSSLNPFGTAYRKAYSLGEFKGQPEKGFFTNLSPANPLKGPPLPAAFNVSWPKFKKEK